MKKRTIEEKKNIIEKIENRAPGVSVKTAANKLGFSSQNYYWLRAEMKKKEEDTLLGFDLGRLKDGLIDQHVQRVQALKTSEEYHKGYKAGFLQGVKVGIDATEVLVKIMQY